MTELVKRYEGERVERDVIKYFEDMSPKQQVVKAFYVQCLFQEFKKLEAINKWLEAQLTWRPVSEEPTLEEMGKILCKIEVFGNDDKISIELWGISLEDWEDFVRRLNVIKWLPIPPEGE